MKLLSAIATICLCVTISTAAEVGAPIQARQAPCSVTLFRGRHFAGPSFTMDSNQCARVENSPFRNFAFSARASPGCVCSLFADPSCIKCNVCVDNNGVPDFVCELPAVGSVQCKLADAAGCSNSNCRLRN